MDEIPAPLQKVFFERVFQIAEVSNYSPWERQQYEESLKYYRDYQNTMDLKFKEGREEGREEGKTQALLETARNMKTRGFDPKTIAEVTGLSPEQIQSLEADDS